MLLNEAYSIKSVIVGMVEIVGEKNLQIQKAIGSETNDTIPYYLS